MNRLVLGVCALVLLASPQAALPATYSSEPALVSKPAARTLYLVRHGHYVADPAIDEKIGPGLSSIGVAQARLAGARIGALRIQFDGLYASPMQRARDTAAVISRKLDDAQFNIVGDLAECTPPSRDATATAKEKPADLAACRAQVDRAFARFFLPARGRDRNDLLVCHGNVIRSLVVRALGVDATAWSSMSVGHASITRIRISSNGSINVTAVGDVGYLPPNLLTGARGDPDRSLDIPALPKAGSK